MMYTHLPSYECKAIVKNAILYAITRRACTPPIKCCTIVT